jgi:hypothetical protein
MDLRSMSRDQTREHLTKVVEESHAAVVELNSARKYKSMLFLCFQWEKDDDQIVEYASDMSKTFEDMFGATVVPLVLEMKNYRPIDVLYLLRDAMNQLKDSQLIVLYYDGCAQVDEEGLIWYQGDDAKQCRFPYRYLEETMLRWLGFLRIDILSIFDCFTGSYFSEAGPWSVDAEYSHEVIAATGSTADVVNQATFTPDMCKLLRTMKPQDGFQVSALADILRDQSETTDMTLVHTMVAGKESIVLKPVREKYMALCIPVDDRTLTDELAKLIKYISELSEIARRVHIAFEER